MAFLIRCLGSFAKYEKGWCASELRSLLLMKNDIIKGNKLIVLKAPSSLGVPHRSQQMEHATDKEIGFLGFRILLKMPFKVC